MTPEPLRMALAQPPCTAYESPRTPRRCGLYLACTLALEEDTPVQADRAPGGIVRATLT